MIISRILGLQSLLCDGALHRMPRARNREVLQECGGAQATIEWTWWSWEYCCLPVALADLVSFRCVFESPVSTHNKTGGQYGGRFIVATCWVVQATVFISFVDVRHVHAFDFSSNKPDSVFNQF